MDVLIPLAPTSPNNFLELRLALRSLEQCTDVGTVYIITTAKIYWLQNAKIVTIDDPFTDNKDKNLIRKIHLTLQQHPEIQDFVLFTDDYIITRPISLNDIPDVYNNRTLDNLRSAKNTKWQNRLKFTLTVMRAMGKDVSCNWDSHTPLRLNREKVLDGLAEFDYTSGGANFTLCTFLANLCDKTKENGVLQDLVKSTCESSTFTVDWNKLLIGYNDAAFNNGLKEILLNKFNKKSIYENSNACYGGPVVVFLTNVTNTNQLTTCIRNAKYPIILLPWDSVSEKAIKGLKQTSIHRYGLSAHNTLMLAKLMAAYSVLFDGNYSYDDFYLDNYVSETAEVSAVIYEPSVHKGIVNNTLLRSEDMVEVPDATLIEVFEHLVDNIRPSILVRENELKEL